jgi:hypothetical protein
VVGADLASVTLEGEKDSPPLEPEKKVVEKPDLEKTGLEPALKPLFWTAAMQTPASSGRADDITGSISVPAELRDLQRCKACGFPVSRGRTLCVECEEKQLRGEPLPQPIAKNASLGVGGAEQLPQQHPANEPAVIPAVGDTPESSALKHAFPTNSSSIETSSTQAASAQAASAQTSRGVTASAQPLASIAELTLDESVIADPVAEDLAQGAPQSVPENVPDSGNSTLFLSSSAPSESWLAANKYVLGVLLVVAIVVGLIVWLR